LAHMEWTLPDLCDRHLLAVFLDSHRRVSRCLLFFTDFLCGPLAAVGPGRCQLGGHLREVTDALAQRRLGPALARPAIAREQSEEAVSVLDGRGAERSRATLLPR